MLPRARERVQTGQISVVPQRTRFRIEDHRAALEIYANKFLGSFFDGGAVNLTFGSVRVPPNTTEVASQTPQAVIHVTHRLVLSPTATVELINSLKSTLTALKETRKQLQEATPQ